jgi:hypothetical protein
MIMNYFNEQKILKGDSVLYKGEVWNYFDMGLSRIVYVNSDRTRVVKFLIDELGVNHNQIEMDIYQSSDNVSKRELAFTQIDENGLVVEQEFVLPIKFSDRELSLKQIQFAGRCRDEVGWDSDGNLKCFDLSEYNKW